MGGSAQVVTHRRAVAGALLVIASTCVPAWALASAATMAVTG